MKFADRVYEVTKRIPSGRVSTYKEVAKCLNTKAYRAVGNALNKNSHAPIVPCHRVVKKSGEVGGFASGTKNKIRLLRKEGIKIEDGKITDFEKVFFKF